MHVNILRSVGKLSVGKRGWPRNYFSAIIYKLMIFESQMMLYVEYFKLLVTTATSYLWLDEGKGGRGWPRVAAGGRGTIFRQ